jgi:hypothetical protein
VSGPDWGEMDQVLKKLIEKRDRALREAESWNNWIKAYEKLVEPLEPLDVLMPRTTAPQAGPATGSTLPPLLAADVLPRAAWVKFMAAQRETWCYGCELQDHGR